MSSEGLGQERVGAASTAGDHGSLRESLSFLRLLWKSARWPLVGAIALSTLLSLTEGLSLAVVFPLITLLGDSTQAASAVPGPRTRVLFGMLAAMHLPRSWWLASLLMVVLLSVALLAQLNGMLSTLTMSMVLRMRQVISADLYRSILHTDWSFLAGRRSSTFTHLLTTELYRAAQLSASFVSVLSNGMVALLMLGIALYLAPLLTLLVLVCFGLLVPWQRRAGRAIYDSGNVISKRMGEVFDSSMERLQNLKVVKAYGAQDAELKLFSSRSKAVSDELLENEWRSIAAARWFQLGSLALLCGLILLGLGMLHLPGATLLLFLFAFLRATPRLNAVQAKGNEILADLPPFRMIEAFLAECEGHSEQGDPSAPSPTLTRELNLRSVTFAYVSGRHALLDDVSLVLPAGQMTAIAGHSGVGKSTVADLVMGLLLPSSGTVEADGVAITRENARSWRRHVGYVSQDTLLFHDSIRQNLLWARPEATEDDLAEAIEAASAGFVYTLAQGIHTPVGDRGMMLSHGQRQRIALARAFLLKPSLLILDEATNSLDLENEENILHTVRRLNTVRGGGAGVTTLLISHRPSAVRVADRVYVMEEGKLTLVPSWAASPLPEREPGSVGGGGTLSTTRSGA